MRASYASQIIQTEIQDRSEADQYYAKGLPFIFSSKVYIYGVTAVISALIIALCLLVGSLTDIQIELISKIINRVGFVDLGISEDFIKEFKFPNGMSGPIIFLNLTFMAIAAWDAFRSDPSYQRYGAIKEAYAISYALHLLFLLLLLINIFIHYKAKPNIKINTIEFVSEQIESPKPPPPKTKKKAKKKSIDAGKHDPTKKESVVKKAPAKPKAPPKRALPKLTPKPKLATPGSKSKAAPSPKSAPAPRSPSRSQSSSNSPAPMARPKQSSSSSKTPNLNIPVAQVPGQSSFKPTMSQSAGRAAGGSSGNIPAPKAYSSGGSGSRSGGNGTASAIRPIRIGGGGSGSGQSNLVNRLGDIKAPTTIDGSIGSDFSNPARNPYADRAPSTAALPDADFGPYMARVQEIIKGLWVPPKDQQSKRIVVIFTINKNGTVTGVKISESNASPAANDAAIDAVHRASPLPQLPVGSPASVDIEFTFDYNVFKRSRY